MTRTGGCAFAVLTGSILLAGACGDDGDNPAAATLALTCSASPSSGTAPLAVAFNIGLTGPVDFVEIQYGDGSTGGDPSAGHLYANPGSYQATVTARGAGAQQSCRMTISAQARSTLNSPPDARFLFNPRPADGPAPLRVVANMCESTDPDGDDLFFTYVWGNGGFHDGGRCVMDHTYRRGVYELRVCVGDQQPGHVDVCQTRNVIAR
jgi:hypothetical protein